MSEDNVKRISRIMIQTQIADENGNVTYTYEPAEIYVPINQVEGLSDHLSWKIVE